MKKNIEHIAMVAHAVNAAYCLSIGDDSQTSWDEAPEWQRLSAIAGVEMHLANPDATPEQSHESWLAIKLADGWTYGETKDAEAKTHPCCVPFDELPQEQKSKDYIFRAVVHAMKDIPAEKVEVEVIKYVGGGEAGSPNMTAVQYIGRRPEWADRLYNSGLTFRSEQVRMVPPELARNLLRHADLFAAPSNHHDDEQDETPVIDDDTEKQLEEGRKQQEAARAIQTQKQDVLDQIAQMTKAGLIKFARENYQQELNQRDTVDAIRGKVVNFVDQFGVV